MSITPDLFQPQKTKKTYRNLQTFPSKTPIPHPGNANQPESMTKIKPKIYKDDFEQMFDETKTHTVHYNNNHSDPTDSSSTLIHTKNTTESPALSSIELNPLKTESGSQAGSETRPSTVTVADHKNDDSGVDADNNDVNDDETQVETNEKSQITIHLNSSIKEDKMIRNFTKKGGENSQKKIIVTEEDVQHISQNIQCVIDMVKQFNQTWLLLYFGADFFCVLVVLISCIAVWDMTYIVSKDPSTENYLRYSFIWIHIIFYGWCVGCVLI